MKYIPFALLALALTGCGRNEFDVSPAEVSSHKGPSKPAQPDHFNLPPGGLKVKKGDKLPDGTIADQAGTISGDGH